MAAISGITPPAAPQAPPAQDQRANRAPVEYGAAVTHRDVVREKLRVDPAALAEKKRAAERAKHDAPRDDEPPRKGRYIDIRV